MITGKKFEFRYFRIFQGEKNVIFRHNSFSNSIQNQNSWFSVTGRMWAYRKTTHIHNKYNRCKDIKAKRGSTLCLRPKKFSFFVVTFFPDHVKKSFCIERDCQIVVIYISHTKNFDKVDNETQGSKQKNQPFLSPHLF